MLKKLLTVCIIFVFIAACSSTNHKNLKNIVYVNDISEIEGIYIKNNLQSYFNASSKENAKYVINVHSISFDQNLYLTSSKGLASREETLINFYWELLDNINNTIIYKQTSVIRDFYAVESTLFGTQNNERRAKMILARKMVENIKLKSYSIISTLENENENNKQKPE